MQKTKGWKMKKLMMSVLMMASISAYSIELELSNVNCGGLPGSSTSGICGDLTDALNDELNQDLPDVSIGDYGTGISNANAFANNGLGSDYSDKFDLFMVRAAGGLSVQGDLDNAESADGVGFGAAATIGVNLDVLPVDKVGPIDLTKMDLFVSFMGYDTEQDLNDTEAEFETSSFGAMARYQLIDGVDFIPGSILSWGGVFVHTGFQTSSFKATATQAFDDEQVEISGGQQATFGDSSATFEIESDITKIPFEVSTYLRAAYVFTVFGGAGFDYILNGSTDVSLDATGTVSGDSSYQATLNASEDDSGDADATNFRAFGGLQFNIPLVRLTLQMNKGLGNDLVGVNFGAKFLW